MDHSLHDVVDVGEIAAHEPLVEHPDRLVGQDRPREQHWRHIRSAPWAIHSDEAQASGGQAVEVAVGVGHQLIGLLGGGIQAHRVVHRLVLGKREISVPSIHRAAGGIYLRLDAVVAATLEHMAETHQIRLDVGGRVLDRVMHLSLGSQMVHPVTLKGRNQL